MVTVELSRYQARLLCHMLSSLKRNLKDSKAMLEEAKQGPDGDLDARGILYGIELCDKDLKVIDAIIPQIRG